MAEATLVRDHKENPMPSEPIQISVEVNGIAIIISIPAELVHKHLDILPIDEQPLVQEAMKRIISGLVEQFANYIAASLMSAEETPNQLMLLESHFRSASVEAQDRVRQMIWQRKAQWN